MSFLLILLPFSYKCALRIIKARSTGTGSGAGISGRCRAAPMKLHMWHNSLKDLIKSRALKRWTEGYRGSARGFFLRSPIWNELLFHGDSRCRGWGQNSDMIKVNVCCVRWWRKPMCTMSRFLFHELQSPRSHQRTCRYIIARGWAMSCWEALSGSGGNAEICDANPWI